jgi:hypothetical protein
VTASGRKAPAKTYGRKSLGQEEFEHGAPEKDADDEDSSGLSSPPGSDSTIEVADGVLDNQGRKKLKDMAKKFQEVDSWEMEFEDVSAGSLDASSQEGKR